MKKTPELISNDKKRRLFTKPVISITGTSGKTTTTNMIYKILQQQYTVNKSHDNSNSMDGIEWCFRTKFDLESDYWVQEIGIGKPGDMSKCLDMVKPTIRVITNVQEAHSCFFHSTEHYQKEKLSFISSAPENSTVIINNDDPLIKAEIAGLKRKIDIIRCGSSESDDVQLVSYTLNPNNITSTITIKVKSGESITFTMNGIGRHYAEDACLAVACGIHCKVPIPAIEQALQNLSLPETRGKIFRIKNLVIYNYSHNMVGGACLKNIETFQQLDSENNLVILGGGVFDVVKKNGDEIYKKILTVARGITPNVVIFDNIHRGEVVGKGWGRFNLPVFDAVDDMYNHILACVSEKPLYVFIQTPNHMTEDVTKLLHKLYALSVSDVKNIRAFNSYTDPPPGMEAVVQEIKNNPAI